MWRKLLQNLSYPIFYVIQHFCEPGILIHTFSLAKHGTDDKINPDSMKKEGKMTINRGFI